MTLTAPLAGTAEGTPCASSCPATAWSPPQAPSRGMPVGWPPRSTCSRWSPAP